MKICWDTLDNLILTKHGNFRKGTVTYVEVGACSRCGHPYLTESSRQSVFCGHCCCRKGTTHTSATKLLLRRLNEGENNPRYGVKVSADTKLKMSNVHKGMLDKKHSVATRKKMVKSRKHVVYTDKWKRNISNATKGNKNPFYGKKHNDETKSKLASYIGPLSSGWKGGISCEPYCKDWTKEYKEYIKERDGYKCLNPYCNSKSSDKLAVHHINYNKKLCTLVNLITICNSCNSCANKDREWHECWYKAILNKRYGYIY